MRVDPLFVDLRIALDNAEPLRRILIDHLAETDVSLTATQRVLVDAGAAQMVQSIYTAAENLLLKVAASIDGGAPPRDENWHAALLSRMSRPFPMRRAALLSAASLAAMNQLRAFRHVVRNNYAHELDRGRLLDNVKVAIALLPALAADVDALQRYMTADDGANQDSTPK